MALDKWAILTSIVFTIGIVFHNKPLNSGFTSHIMNSPASDTTLTLFLCGDVMTGRGLDQAFPTSAEPQIYESYIKDARAYLRLAEDAHGDIRTPIAYDYIWGDAVSVWQEKNPALKIINLETAVTVHGGHWPGKGINYRMHPENIETLKAAGIDFCSLANNHTLDWNRRGLEETLQTLDKAGIAHAGAGKNRPEAMRPAVLSTESCNVILLACGLSDSGIPPSWQATDHQGGVYLLEGSTSDVIANMKREIDAVKKPGDIVIISIHWGNNWGYKIPQQHRELGYRFIDEIGANIVHGHSSHHPRPLEVYKGRLIIYGAGDFINDYEGISGYEKYRDDLCLMYFPTIDLSSGELLSLIMVPMQIRNFRLNYPPKEDIEWLRDVINRECRKSGVRVEMNAVGELVISW